ncbi:hypothetical protein Lser_V15G12412 [Lactuca serriola]
MTGDGSTPNTTSHKVFGISNIKSLVPLILDLERANYDDLRQLFMNHCEAYNAIEHIEETYDEPNHPPTEPIWKKVGAIVKGCVYSTLSHNLLNTVLKNQTNARKLWLMLDRLFRANKDTRAIQLDFEIRSINMGDMSMLTYCNKIKTTVDQLNNLNPKINYQKNLVIYTINGLASHFNSVGLMIRHRQPFPTFDETHSILTS